MSSDDQRPADDAGPTEPTGPETPDPGSPTRRHLLAVVSATLMGAIGTLVAIPAVGFLLTPSRRDHAEVWSPVGRASDFPLGQTLTASYLQPDALPWDGVARFGAVMLRRTGPERFIAFSPYCTHVGCPVRWDDSARLFLCPCHGGAYYEDGTVAAGPPPRPLVRHRVRVVAGVVEVLTRPIRLPG